MINRRGYVLISVLWLSVGLVGLATVVTAATRESMVTSNNRVAMTQATWAARACLATVRARLDAALNPRDADAATQARVWWRLDALVSAAPLPPESPCRVSATANGSQLDANVEDSSTLAGLFERNGLPRARSDSVVIWILGHRPFETEESLAGVLERHGVGAFSEFLGVGVGPIALNHAPPKVLVALPGFTIDVAERVLRDRRTGNRLDSFQALLDAAPLRARDSVEAALPLLIARVTLDASHWTVMARSTAGKPEITAVLEQQVRVLNGFITVSQTRSWFE